MSRGTGLLRVASQGLSLLFLKTFAAFYHDPTDSPWVSEDVLAVQINWNNRILIDVVKCHHVQITIEKIFFQALQYIT